MRARSDHAATLERLEHARAQISELRIACTEAAMYIESMRVVPGGVRDKLIKRLRGALASTHVSV